MSIPTADIMYTADSTHLRSYIVQHPPASWQGLGGTAGLQQQLVMAGVDQELLGGITVVSRTIHANSVALLLRVDDPNAWRELHHRIITLLRISIGADPASLTVAGTGEQTNIPQGALIKV